MSKVNSRQELLNRLSMKRDGCSISAEGYQKRAINIEQMRRLVVRNKGGKWRDVRRVKLIMDKKYIVRHTMRPAYFGMPVIAQWTNNGWIDIDGHVESSHATNSSLEIWS